MSEEEVVADYYEKCVYFTWLYTDSEMDIAAMRYNALVRSR